MLCVEQGVLQLLEEEMRDEFAMLCMPSGAAFKVIAMLCMLCMLSSAVC